MKFKPWKYSVYRRALATFLVIMVTILFTTGLLFLYQTKMLEEKINDSAHSQVNYALNSIEDELDGIVTLGNGFLNNQYANRLAIAPDTLDEIARMQFILQLQYQLLSLETSSEYIEKAIIMIPDAALGISSSSSLIFDQKLYDGLTANYQYPFTVYNDTIYMCFFTPFSTEQAAVRSAFYLTYVEISQINIAKTLQSMIDDESELGLLIIDDECIALGKHNSSAETLREEIESGSGKVSIDNSQYSVISKDSGIFELSLHKLFPTAQFMQPLRLYRVFFVAFLLFSLLLTGVYIIYIYRSAHLPLVKLVDAFRQIEKDNFDIHLDEKSNDEYGFIFKRFNKLADHLSYLINQVYRQTILVQEAELKQLQAQINPHFLYNSFFGINTLAQVGDLDTLQEFTKMLGEYFQFITRNASPDIELHAEVAHAQNYIDIQALRFRNRLTISFESVPENARDIMVPRLILQPLLENIFEHGVDSKDENVSISVWFGKEDGLIQIHVENSDSALSEKSLEKIKTKLSVEDESVETTGILNIHKRLQLYYETDRSGLDVQRSGMGGLHIVISIPNNKE